MAYNYSGEGEIYNTGLFEFESVFTVDESDLNSVASGSGVHLNRAVEIDLGILDRSSGDVSTQPDFLDNSYVQKIDVDILDITGGVKYSDFLVDYKSNFLAFTEYDNFKVFGDYAKHFGVKIKLEDRNSGVHTSEFYFYGNEPIISGIAVQDSTGTTSHTGSLSSKTAVNSTGQTGALTTTVTFLNDTNYISFDRLDIYYTDTSDFDLNLNPQPAFSRNLTNNNTQSFDLNEGDLPNGEAVYLHYVPYGNLGSGDSWSVGPYTFADNPITDENFLTTDDTGIFLTGITSGDITGALGYTPISSSETNDQTLDEVLTQGNTSSQNISVGAITGSALTIDTDTLHVDSANNRVGIGTTSPDYDLDISGDLKYSGTLHNGPREEYVNSNIIRVNQRYTGGSIGNYFEDGEYQKVVTITPDGSSQNYQIVGKLYVQSGSATQTIEFDATLRSETLPDLSWEIYYNERHTGIRFIKPVLWTKETSTAAWIIAFEVLTGSIYGSVTADIDIIPRNSNQKDNVVVNTTTNSEQSSVESGFTQREYELRSRWNDKDSKIEGNLTANQFIKESGISSEFLKADGSVDSSSYLTGVSQSDVTTALGYTPVDVNDTGDFVTSSETGSFLTDYTVTNDDVTGALGYTPVDPSNTGDFVTSSETGSFLTDYTVTEADVTGHQAALTITESQISDLGSYLTSVSESDVTQHEGALTLTSGQITGALGFSPISTETDDQTLDEVLTQGNTSQSGITVGSSTISGDLDVSGSLTVTNDDTGVSDIFSVDGVNGRLFGVTDEVTGTVFSVNDAAGLPIVEVESTSTYDKITIGEYGSDALVISGTNSAIFNVDVDITGGLDVTGDITMAGNTVLTGITSSDVTDALGYTPVSVNDTGSFVTSSETGSFLTDYTVTNDDVTGALGYTPVDVNDTGDFVTSSETGDFLTAHPSIAAASSSDNSARTYIQDVLLDSFGHVTGLNTSSESTDPNYYLTGVSKTGNVFTFEVNGATNPTYTLTSGDITSALGFSPISTETDSQDLDSVLGYGNSSELGIIVGDISGTSLDITTDVTVTGDVEADEFIGDLRGAVSFRAKAGEALSAGEVVYISGIDGNTTVVAKADANDPNKMPAFGISKETVNANANVRVVNFGSVTNLDTSNYSEGDELFVSDIAGQLTGIAPTGEASALQKMAKVTRSDNSAGSITVMGAGRSNAVPNLNEGRLFVGNSSNEAVADGTVFVDIANSNVGIGTTDPSSQLTISKNSSSTYTSSDAGTATGDLVLQNNNQTVNNFNRISFQTPSANSGGNILDAARITAIYSDHGGANPSAHLSFETKEDAGTMYERMRIDSDGNVGIGTTSPSRKFEVHEGNVYLKVGAQSGFADGYGPILTTNSNSIVAPERVYLAASQAYIRRENIGGQGLTLHGDTFSRFTYYNGSSTVEALRIDNAGNVGIGTTSPSAPLDISSSATGGTTIELDNTSTGGRNWTLYSSGSGNSFGAGKFALYDADAASVRMLVDTSGNVGIGTASPDKKLNVHSGTTSDIVKFQNNNGSIVIGKTANLGSLDMASDASFRIRHGSTVSAFFKSDGNVGIGITNPNDFLQVKSSMSIVDSDGTNVHCQLFSNASEGVLRIHNGANWGLIARGQSNNPYLGAYYGGSLNIVGFSTSDGSTIQSTLATFDFGNSQFKLYDSKQLVIGDGADLRLFHNGTNSIIHNDTGNLLIEQDTTDGDIIFKSDNGSGGLATYFYLDGSIVNGTTVCGATRFPDKSKIMMGTDGDLKIYHDGSNSYVEDSGGTGSLYVNTNAFRVHSADGSDEMIKAVEGASGGAFLYHNNILRLSTTSTGVSITGTTTIDNVLVLNRASGSYGAGLRFHEAGTKTWQLKDDQDGGNNNSLILENSSDTPIVTFEQDGKVGIGETSPDSLLHISSSTSGDAVLTIEADTDNNNENDNPYIHFKQDGGGVTAKVGIEGTNGLTFTNSLGNHAYLGSDDHGVQLYANGAAGLTLRGDGDIGIGTNVPATRLDVYKSTSTSGGSTGTPLLRLHNYVGSDLSQQKTFIDFTLTDDNGNETPQVRIGAEVGQNGDANSQAKEGCGAFVVYTNNADTDSGDAGASLAERMRVDYQGNVGIGTTSPDNRLEVVGPYAATPLKVLRHGDYGNVIQIGRNGVSETANIGYPADSTINFSTAGSERVRINSSGNVGIGETSIDAKLHLTALSSGLINQKFESAGSAAWRLGIPASQTYFAFDNANDDLSAPKVIIDSSGNVGIGTTGPSSKFHINDTFNPSSGDYITSKIYSNGSASANGNSRIGLDVETNRNGWFNADIIAGNFKVSNDHRIGNSNIIGVKSLATLDVNNSYSSVASSGSLTAFYGKVTTTFSSGESPVSNAFGLRIAAPSVAASTSINSYYGIYIDGASTSGTVNNKYAFVTEADAGNVGIGTTSPATSNKLEVNGQVRVVGAQMIGNSATSNVVTTGVQLHIKNTGEAKIRLEDSDSSNLAFDILVNEGSGFSIKETVGGDSGDDTRLFIQETSGNVGIGTTSPDYELHVIGTASFTDTVAGAYFEENASHPSLKKLDTGTILVMNEEGQLVPCSKADDTMVFGVSKHGYKQPIVMGAEPIKVTGPIKVGDYITTSDVLGHGKKSNQPYPFGTIIAQAMESGDGESYNIKAMIRKM